MGILTEDDKTILPMALRANGGFYAATRWYLRGWDPLWFQYEFHHYLQKNTTFLAGIACVDGDTRVLNPRTMEENTIADLEMDGSPMDVLSFCGSGFIPAKASPPFLKGTADLYRVTFADGSSIVTTLEHRFLTIDGYRALRELRRGSLVGAPSTPRSSTPLEGALRFRGSRTNSSVALQSSVDSSYLNTLQLCYDYNTDITWRQVVSIKFEKTGRFYDLTVPGWNNYVANGVVNHNSGKSTTIAASNIIDCLTTPYFRALNTSVTAKQSEIPFEMISGWFDGNSRIEHLIEDVSLRPYPTIKFKNGSEYIFRTAGRDGRFIRGLEFDRINYDEAGLDALGETIKILRGRLRGVRPDGTQRMARLDVTTSPTDAIWLKERFYKGWEGARSYDPVAYKSMRATTFMNTRLDPEQIRMMTLEYTDEMAAVELMAEFPDYGMSFFPSSHITACTDQDMNDEMEEAVNPEGNRLPKKGYVLYEDNRHGILKFEMPHTPGHYYIMAGDPGTDDPPRRNSAVVMCFDMTSRPMKLVYFDWVMGHGSYNPFLQSFKYCMAKYGPVYSGMDTTGTQKAIDELAFSNYGITIDGINFNRDKEGMLNSLSLAITSHQFKWPVIKGLIRQLSAYTRDNDKDMPQDIVMTLAQVSYLARYEGASPSDVTSVVRPFRKTRSRTGRWRRR